MSRKASNNDIDNPMARPKQKFSREDRMPPNTATVRVITVFTVFRMLTDFVCLYNYEF
jgi:hypothetical protein